MVSQPSSNSTRLGDSDEPLGRRLVAARIWSLLTALRLSADEAYRPRTGIVELDRRLLMTLDSAGPATPLALTATLGHDKAQLSRALKRLDEAGYIRRAGLRGPVTLSKAGEAINAKMLAIAAERNVLLLDGIDAAEAEAFSKMVRRLTERAVALFARERAFAGDADTRSIEPLPLAPSQPRHALLAAELMTLLVYLQRSGALSYKRLIGLSSFDWQVLSQAAEHAPLPLAQLILMLGRDKGQAGRTVKRLEELGLIERRRASGRRAVLLHPTERGQAIYRAMAEHGLERNAFLTTGIEPKALNRFLTTLDKMTANAERMLDAARKED